MRREDETALAYGRPQRRTVDDDPRSVLAQLLLTVRKAVATLERDAVRTQTDRAIAAWSFARRCARELSLVTDALGADARAEASAAQALGPDLLEGMERAYERALAYELPRPVRAVLDSHRQRVHRARRSPLAMKQLRHAA